MRSYVNGLMFDHQGPFSRFVAIQKNRPDWQIGLWNGIGGKIEEGESPLQALIREFREETTVQHEDWIPFIRLYRENVYEVFFFVAWSGKVFNVKTNTDEVVRVLQANQIQHYPMVPNMNWLVPMALDPCVLKGKFLDIEDKLTVE